LCAVGDSDQSIYGWRGADIRNILQFERDYPDAKVIRLEQNYRSTKTILKVANQVIRNNQQRREKNLWTENPEGERVVLYQAGDERVEARYVLERIQELCEQGRAYRDFAILYRTNAQSRVLEEHLLQHGIPYRIFGGVRFYERKEIKDVLAYLRLVLNADDDMLLQLSNRLQARVILFSTSDGNPAVIRHLALGGVAYFAANGWLVEARGHLTWEIAPVADIPITMNGRADFQVENCLAAAAALRALGLTRQQVAASLASFLPSRDNLGRCMIYQLPGGGHVVLDYGHNPDGFAKIGRWLHSLPHRRLIGVVGVPGDRANQVIRQSAEQLARIFDGFVVKEDADKRGRQPGEVAALLAERIQAMHPEKPCIVILDEPEALRHAITAMEAGDVVVMFYENLAQADQVVRSFGGVPAALIQVSSPSYAVPL
ncbi:MAG: UvrD-helicase domain-containing protein, partial [Alicyclobacillus sp.]|nr:UvrD-helicase domain-containing protein [Alicyclobacillus sp.]